MTKMFEKIIQTKNREKILILPISGEMSVPSPSLNVMVIIYGAVGSSSCTSFLAKSSNLVNQLVLVQLEFNLSFKAAYI